MKARNFKRWVAGLCATAMLAGAPAMVGYATGTMLDNEMKTGNTTVTATVVENDNQPTYTITIPDTVDFGQIKWPTTAATAYANTTITVECRSVSNLASDQVISVLVKDGNATGHDSSFLLTSTEHPGSTLRYEMLDGSNQSIETATWYNNGGFLYATFNSAGQTKTMTLSLDKSQLHGKDLADWGGAYSGTLNFTTKVGSVSSVQSMEEGTPVVVW